MVVQCGRGGEMHHCGHILAETAVVGFPHDLYGEGRHYYVLHLCTFVMEIMYAV